MSLLPKPPLIVLRPERGGPSKDRMDRIDAYMRVRDARAFLAYEREQKRQKREQERFVPCAICGSRTEPWERIGIPDRLAICTPHHKSMPGPYPLGRVRFPAELPPGIDDLYHAARRALYVFTKEIAREEAHAKATAVVTAGQFADAARGRSHRRLPRPAGRQAQCA
jgi:hypothetical protein